jgi:DNA-binding CsgD family transcriptional regulator
VVVADLDQQFLLSQTARRGPWNDCGNLPAVVEAASRQAPIGLGEPKRRDQRDRYFQSQCIYCGSPKPTDLLGPACGKTQCQEKRWVELNLTEKQKIVFRGLYDDKQNSDIASEMGISTHRVKEHIRAIARKFDVHYSRTLLVRCYYEWQDHVIHQAAISSPQPATPLQSTPRKRPARK